MNGWRAVALAWALAVLGACGDGPSAAAGGAAGGKGGEVRAFPVEVQPVDKRALQLGVRATGSVDAFERVQVTARVAGAVERVRFSEGAVVEKGQPLAEIEPARYRLAVRSAQANLARARAAGAQARAQLERREAVTQAHPGLIPGEEVGSVRTQAATTEAEIQAAQVLLEQAQLNLRDAFVRAPIDGVMQTRSVQTGQYVQPGTVLGTLLQRDPLLVRFRVPEADAARLTPGAPLHFKVGDGGAEHTAVIRHVGGAAEDASRLVAITAVVEDGSSEAVRPGAFAEIRVPIAGGGVAPIVPQAAVRPSERGFLAFVVEDGKARERVIKLGLRTADGMVEVKEGLAPGEILVVRGAEALVDGRPVRVVTGGGASVDGQPAAARGGRSAQ